MTDNRGFTKSNLATLDYGVAWTNWLESGEIITASTWTIAPSGLTVVNDDEFDDDKTYIWLSGGALDETYYVTNKITTNQGREDARTLVIVVKQR